MILLFSVILYPSFHSYFLFIESQSSTAPTAVKKKKDELDSYKGKNVIFVFMIFQFSRRFFLFFLFFKDLEQIYLISLYFQQTWSVVGIRTFL